MKKLKKSKKFKIKNIFKLRIKKPKKINKTKIALSLGTLVLLAIPVVAIYLNKGISLSSSYKDTQLVDVVFDKDIQMDIVEEKVREVKNYERFEKTTPTEFKISYLDLSSKEKDKITENLKGIEGYKGVSYIPNHKINPSVQSFIYLTPLFALAYILGAVVVSKKFKTRIDKLFLAKALVLSLALTAYIDAGVLAIYSYFVPVDPEIFELLVFEAFIGIGLSLFILMQMNLTGEFVKNFSLFTELKNYLQKYNRKNLVVDFISILVMTAPFIYIAHDRASYAILLVVLFLINVLGFQFLPALVFDFVDQISKKIPFIKNMKWIRR